MVGVDGGGLLHVEAGRVGQDIVDVEGFGEFLDAEDVAVGSDGPAEQSEVVDESLGDEPVLAVEEQVRFGVALRQLLVALTHDVGQVAELRGRLGDADGLEVFVESDLTRGRGQDVLAAEHMGDTHERVVDGVDQGVQRLAIGTNDDEVGNSAGLEGDVAAHEVGEGDVLIGHAHAPHGFATLGAEGSLLLVGEVAVVPVVAEFGVTARSLVAGLDLLVGGVGLVDVAAGLELLDDVSVDLTALRLAVGSVVAADLDAFVPVQAQPFEGLDDLAEALLGVTCRVGVLDAEDELAAGVLGIGPVEQGRADHADVRGAGG